VKGRAKRGGGGKEMSFKELLGRTTDKNQSLECIQSVEREVMIAWEVQWKESRRMRMVFEGGKNKVESERPPAKEEGGKDV